MGDLRVRTNKNPLVGIYTAFQDNSDHFEEKNRE